MIQPHAFPAIQTYSRLLAESFARMTGKALLDGWRGDEAGFAETLFEAPFPLVSHGTQTDPIFCYANCAALALWEMTWDDFIQLPSRRSAETVSDIQQERQRLLAEAMQKGWVDNYSGVRISATGKRFMIRDTVLWNVTDNHGTLHGQAARIGHWKML